MAAVVNVTGVFLKVGGLGDIHAMGYNISKWSNIAMTRSFADVKPDPYESEGIKAYALAPWFAETRMVLEGFNEDSKFETRTGSTISCVEDLKRVTRHRILTKQEVGEAMIQSLRRDKTGAVYVIFPDCALIEYPQFHNASFAVTVLIAKLATRLGLEVMSPWQFLALALVVLFGIFYILQMLLCFVF